MSSSEVLYTARVEREYIERNRAQLLKCPAYRDGALAAPSSGTVTVYNEADTKLVDAAAVTIASSVAQYSIGASTTADEDLGEGWRVEWALVMPDTITHTFRVPAALVRRRLYPVVTDADLIRRHADLSDLMPTTLSSYQDYIDEAWGDIMERIVSRGMLPYLVMDAAALRRVHMYHALELIWVDFSTSAGDGRYLDLAKVYRDKFSEAWRELKFDYDLDNDGAADGDAGQKQSANPLIFLA